MSAVWQVRVPASTSNLGPGFDLMGLALGLSLDVRLTASEGSTHELVRSGEGATELPGPQDDLVLKSFERVRARMPFEGLCRFEVRSEIPVGRGLGSSG